MSALSADRLQAIFECENYNISKLSDAKLYTNDGCTFRIHRAILARSSPYFLHLFLHDMETERLVVKCVRYLWGIAFDSTKSFYIPCISGECLSELIIFIYTKNISVTDSNAKDIFLAAYEFKLTDLVQHLKENIERFIATNQFLPILAYVERKCPEIVEDFSRYIHNHLKEFLLNQRSQLSELPFSVFSSVINTKRLDIRDEGTVLLAIQDWVYKDSANRKIFVMYLLNRFARTDLDEHLATQIMEHEIVKYNPFCRGLNSFKSSAVDSSNLDVLQNYLANNINHAINSECRMDSTIHIIIRYDVKSIRSKIFLTYDENFHLWRKIAEAEWHILSRLMHIDYNLYAIGYADGVKTIRKFDLRQNQWVSTTNFRRQYVFGGGYILALKVSNRLFILSTESPYNENATYYVDIYDPEADTWSDGVPLLNIKGELQAKSIGTNIYVVESNYKEQYMTVQVYNTEIQTWSSLPSPNTFYSFISLVANRRRLYIVAHESYPNTPVQAFDLNKNEWSELPQFWMEYPLACILMEQLYIYNEEEHENIIHWNEAEERWEKAKNISYVDLNTYTFSTIDDPHVTAFIREENRKSETKFEECPLWEVVQ